MENLFGWGKEKESTEDKKGFLCCDGGSRGNPGPSAGGCVLYDEEKKEIARGGSYYGIQTNNFAEYRGMIEGLLLAQKNNISHLKVFLDSKLIVEQMSGRWKVKNANIKPLYQEACEVLKGFKKVDFMHILREKNKIADGIVNEVLDKNKKNGIR